MANTNMVYIPQKMSVQMPATQENPGGRVVHLNEGWVELDEDMADHPILAKLQGETPEAAERNRRLAEAQTEYDSAVAEAANKLAQTRLDIQQEATEDENRLSEEWNDRSEDAAQNNMSFNEAHPNMEARRAIALTSNHGHSVPAASMAQKPQAFEEAKKVRESLPSQSEQTNMQRERIKTDTNKPTEKDPDPNASNSDETDADGKKRSRAKTEG